MEHKEYIIRKFTNYSSCFIKNAEAANQILSVANIHALRVSIRRLLSINCFIENFANDGYYLQIRKHLKQIIKKLNPLRDTQVQIEIVGKAMSNDEGLQDFYFYLLNKEKKISDKNDSLFPEFEINLINDLLIWQKQFISSRILPEHFSNISIIKSLEEIEKEIDEYIKQINISDENSIHNLRLVIKRYRYIVEVISEMYPENNIYIKPIKKLQTAMGKIQDISVLLEEIAEYKAKNIENLSNSLNYLSDTLIADKQYNINKLMALIDKYQTPKIEKYFKKLEYF